MPAKYMSACEAPRKGGARARGALPPPPALPHELSEPLLSRQITDEVRLNVGRRLSQLGAKGDAGITSLRLLRDPFRDIGYRYEILGEAVARGGFAEVFKVRDLFTNEIRAAKRVPKDRISDNSLLQRELEMLLTLDHPNVVRLFEWFESEDAMWLIQEMCTGGEVLNMVGNCSPRDALRVVRQVLLGLSYLHDRGVIHRDVKLENCMFQTQARDSVVKIIDFGLSGVALGHLKRSTGITTSTIPNTGKAGTAIYQSPELLATPDGQAPKYSPKTDMWALGVMTFILLTTNHPFWNTKTPFVETEMHLRIRAGPPDLSNILPETAADLVSGLLQVNESARLNAHEALMHPCMRVSAFLCSDLHLRLMTNLRCFKIFRPFQRVILTVMAYHAKEDALREVFNLLDTDMNGVLSKEEIARGMHRLGLILPPDFDSILTSIDSDSSGQIDFTEFCAAGLSAAQIRDLALIDCTFSWLCSDVATGKISVLDLERVVPKTEVDFVVDHFGSSDKTGLSRLEFRCLVDEIASIKESHGDEEDVEDEEKLVRSSSSKQRRLSLDEALMSLPSTSLAASLRRNSDAPKSTKK